MNNRARLATVFALVASIVACDSSSTQPDDVDNDDDTQNQTPENTIPTGIDLKMSVAHDSLFYGNSVTFTITDAAGTPATPYTWTSSNPDVAVVDQNGTVLAVGIGTARITVERTGARDTFKLRTMAIRADGGVSFTAGAEGGGTIAPKHCAIATNASIYCREGTGDSLRLFQKMPGAAGVEFVSASVSFWGQCGLTSEGEVRCWGPNNHGYYATSKPVVTDTGPVPAKTDLRFLSMQHGGHSQTCGVSKADSLVYCWGHNDQVQLGRPSPKSPAADDTLPTPVVGMSKAIAVATENSSTCAIALEGQAYCSPPFQNTRADSKMELVPGNNVFKSIVNGDKMSCAIDTGNKGWCWGLWALGDGLPPSSSKPPVAVAGQLRFKKLSAVQNKYVCGITLEDDLYCWGDFPPLSISSRLGDKRYAPVQLMKGTKFRDVTGGLCGITTDGRMICW